MTAVDSLLPDYGGNLFNLDGYEDKVRINIADVRGHGMEYLVRGQTSLQSRGTGQSYRLDDRPDDRPRDQLPQPALDPRGCPSGQSRSQDRLRGHPADHGRPRYLPVDENHLLAPTDVNGINKISGRSTTSSTTRSMGSGPARLRLTNTYGPRQLVRHNRQGFIGWFVRLATLGDEIQIFGDGSQRRDFNHVDDVVDAILRAGALEPATGR